MRPYTSVGPIWIFGPRYASVWGFIGPTCASPNNLARASSGRVSANAAGAMSRSAARAGKVPSATIMSSMDRPFGTADLVRLDALKNFRVRQNDARRHAALYPVADALDSPLLFEFQEGRHFGGAAKAVNDVRFGDSVHAFY